MASGGYLFLFMVKFTIVLAGISMSGSCLGTFVLAPLSSVISENYGWRATVGLYAGIFNLYSTC